MKDQTRGEIVTLIAAAVVVIIGITSFITSTFLSKKNNTTAHKPKADTCRQWDDQLSGFVDVECGPPAENNPPPVEHPIPASLDDFNQLYPNNPNTAYNEVNIPLNPPAVNNPSSVEQPGGSCSCVNGAYQGSGCVGGQWGEPCGLSQEYQPISPSGNTTASTLSFCSNNFSPGTQDYSDCMVGYQPSQPEPTISYGGNYYNASSATQQKCNTVFTPGTGGWNSCLDQNTGYKGEGCFLPGTKILMADGNYKGIQNVKQGDVVASYDVDTKKIVQKKVLEQIIHPKNNGGYLIINNTLKVTGIHPLWVNNTDWKQADEVKIGDYLLSDNGNLIAVKTIEFKNGIYSVYNLSVEGPSHNYFAEDILVHNKLPMPFFGNQSTPGLNEPLAAPTKTPYEKCRATPGNTPAECAFIEGGPRYKPPEPSQLLTYPQLDANISSCLNANIGNQQNMDSCHAQYDLEKKYCINNQKDPLCVKAPYATNYSSPPGVCKVDPSDPDCTNYYKELAGQPKIVVPTIDPNAVEPGKTFDMGPAYQAAVREWINCKGDPRESAHCGPKPEPKLLDTQIDPKYKSVVDPNGGPPKFCVDGPNAPCKSVNQLNENERKQVEKLYGPLPGSGGGFGSGGSCGGNCDKCGWAGWWAKGCEGWGGSAADVQAALAMKNAAQVVHCGGEEDVAANGSCIPKTAQPYLQTKEGKVPLYTDPKVCRQANGDKPCNCKAIEGYCAKDEEIPPGVLPNVSPEQKALQAQYDKIMKQCMYEDHSYKECDESTRKYLAIVNTTPTPPIVAPIPNVTVVQAPPSVTNCTGQAQNSVCGGGGGTCQSQGLFGWGAMGCDECRASTIAVPGQGCVDFNKTSAGGSGAGCDEGGLQIVNNKVLSCISPNDTKKGIWVGLDGNNEKVQQLVQAKSNGTWTNTQFNGYDAMKNAVSQEDANKIRGLGYDTVSDQCGKTGDWGCVTATRAMQVGDWIGQGFGWMGAQVQKGAAATGKTLYGTDQISILGNNFGDKYAETGSSLGNYYVKSLETKMDCDKYGWNSQDCGFIQGSNPLEVGAKALAVGLGGGLKFADQLTLGLVNTAITHIEPINALTGGGIDGINNGLLNVAYGNNEKGKQYAQSAQTAGMDLTNVVALLVPAGKSVGGLSSGISKIGTRLTEVEGLGAIAARPAGTVLKLVGEGGKLAGKGLEYASPEQWASGFIKGAPITTRAEAVIKAAGTSLPAKGAQLAVKAANFIDTKIPAGSKILSAGNAVRDAAVAVGESRVGQAVATAVKVPVEAAAFVAKKGSDFLIPRSALTYGVEDAANMLARDVKLGLTDEAGAMARLQGKYHVNLSPGEVNQFNKSFKQALNTSGPQGSKFNIPSRVGGTLLEKADNWLGKLNESPLQTKSSTSIAKNVKSQLDFGAQRAQLLPQRVAQVAEAEAKGGALARADKAAIKDLGKEFKNIKHPDELAEAIINKMEAEKVAASGKFKITPNRPIQMSADEVALAKRYAEEIAGQRASVVSKAVNNVRDYFRPKAQAGFESGVSYDGITYARTKKGEPVLKLNKNTKAKAFINGEEVTKSQVLKSGDKVVIQRPQRPSFADEEYVFKGISPVDPAKRAGKQKFAMEYKLPPDHNQPLGQGGNRQLELAGQKKSFSKAGDLGLEDVRIKGDPSGKKVTLFDDGATSSTRIKKGSGYIAKEMPDGSFKVVTGKGAEMKPGNVFDFGGQKMKVVETPGKAMYLVDEAGKRAPVKLKSGGVLGDLRDNMPLIGKDTVIKTPSTGSSLGQRVKDWLKDPFGRSSRTGVQSLPSSPQSNPRLRSRNQPAPAQPRLVAQPQPQAPAQPAPRPAAPRPAAAVRAPKQEFNWLERLTGKPGVIERQVRRQLRGASTLDEYKNALRAAGYAEREIDAAAARIQASFPQAAPMAGVPQNVPIKPPPPPPKALAKPVTQPQVGSGAVQSQALASHGNVVQDAVYVRPDKAAFAVADGVSDAGPASINTARDASKALADRFATDAKVLGSDYKTVYESVNRAAHDLDTSLANKYNASATVVAGYVTPNGKLITFRIGDTEARIVRNGQIAHLDNLVNAADNSPLFQGNFLSPDMAYGNTRQSIVSNMPNQIGSGKISDGRLTVHSLKPGDRIIYTSDGIAKVLNENEINNIVSRAKTLQEAENALIQAALSKGLVDDYSAVVIFY